MRRAYLIYAAVLLLLYVGLTFFGKLILETVGRLPIAGAQVDTGNLDFSSPQWPLMLAFGFAGLAPLIPPLRVAETWLRSRAHRAVGHPDADRPARAPHHRQLRAALSARDAWRRSRGGRPSPLCWLRPG